MSIIIKIRQTTQLMSDQSHGIEVWKSLCYEVQDNVFNGGVYLGILGYFGIMKNRIFRLKLN